jgi:hypothetical protein
VCPIVASACYFDNRGKSGSRAWQAVTAVYASHIKIDFMVCLEHPIQKILSSPLVSWKEEIDPWPVKRSSFQPFVLPSAWVNQPENWLPIAPVDLTARLLKEVIRRAGVDSDLVEDVIWGVVTPVGDQGANLARLALLMAGLPAKVPGVSLNRMCGSSQQAVHFAAQAIISGDMDVVIAGGTEMMSHQPLGSDYPSEWPANFPYELVHQGVSAEMMAQKWSLTRDELDDFGYESHLRAMRAIQGGCFESQVLPVAPAGWQLLFCRRGGAHAS